MFRTGIDRQARRTLHAYLADAHRANDLYQRIEAPCTARSPTDPC